MEFAYERGGAVDSSARLRIAGEGLDPANAGA